MTTNTVKHTPDMRDRCPICDDAFEAADLCASDIDMGCCHAACLEGSEIVDLETGEPSDGPVDTYRYDELLPPAPQEKGRG